MLLIKDLQGETHKLNYSFPYLPFFLLVGPIIFQVTTFTPSNHFGVISIPTLTLLFCFQNNNSTIMKILKFVMIDFSTFLSIKVTQFIYLITNLLSKNILMMIYGPNHFGSKFLKLLLSWWLSYTITKSPFWNLSGFTFLLKDHFWHFWANLMAC